MISCDRCQGSTTEKRITSKKDGKQYTVYQCDSGCMNGKFAYSMFAPRGTGQAQTKQSFNQAPPKDNDVFGLILNELRSIRQLLQKQTEGAPF